MTSESITVRLRTVKIERPDRFWVKCKYPKCFWIHEVPSEKIGRIRAFGHVTIHPVHEVELHTVKTEVIRHGQEKNI